MLPKRRVREEQNSQVGGGEKQEARYAQVVLLDEVFAPSVDECDRVRHAVLIIISDGGEGPVAVVPQHLNGLPHAKFGAALRLAPRA